jgi:hypothetical protein
MCHLRDSLMKPSDEFNGDVMVSRETSLTARVGGGLAGVWQGLTGVWSAQGTVTQGLATISTAPDSVSPRWLQRSPSGGYTPVAAKCTISATLVA